MAMKGDASYAAAKAGLVGLTRSLALDESAYGITANAISPGWIATGSQTKAEAAEAMSTPIGRSGTPEEVAVGICWLADAQNGYLTGQNIVIDGGNSIAEERL
jgi:3-oxoacyl-[acyl-carrier protein] reductase